MFDYENLLSLFNLSSIYSFFAILRKYFPNRQTPQTTQTTQTMQTMQISQIPPI
ncbi:hypothetical protein DLEV_192 [Diachasmimorpha longicaudata entomopoxvirus]|uniref:Uncharacterized protein n=1 Tax=Diachasmimorpha longicaudata entomopoxvirus TaxID=109981 RepID=A0A7R5WJK0_9POXV|nr:hypothetical protein QKK69_gp002 [Diachasmimorpha longicaudata entomopoxvirus]YP_010796939.1 hypothetical protein QKK69_gp192 [Diachasmimorpha longicaudata entomopoxvirus]AKS26293.1 hypothetical protein DLEV_002 [Diachasmimorpha longicaudata entomopoxvirus]AKS26483.1 hypothetical protein DLEV_192 [Diachasmimorpha longicaudata entomopoxvirus]